MVRYSDFLKKGNIKKDTGDNREPAEAAVKEQESFRLSDLEVYKAKSRSSTLVPVKVPESTSEEAREEEKEQEVESFSLKEFQDFRMAKKKASQPAAPSQTPPPKVPGQERSEKDERIRASEVIVQDRDDVLRKSAEMPLGIFETSDERGLKDIVAIEERVINPEPVRHEGDPAATDSGPAENAEAEEKRRVGGEEIDVAPPIDSFSVLSESVNPGALYDEAARFIQSVKGKIMAARPFEIEPAVAVIKKIVEDPERLKELYPLTMRSIDGDDYNIPHQVNVMVYTLKLGLGLGYSPGKLIDLGLSSLFHDVGMFRIPESVTLKRGKLTGTDVEIIKTHTEIGREILNPFKGRYPSLPDVAFEHHERENGQGYPRGLKGNDIHEYASIVSLLDSYEAMTHNRPYRKALEQSFSAKELIKSKQSLFSPQVVKVFLREISLYPLGTYVKLNNKAIAQVVATDQNHPLRPSVRILYDGEGHKVFDEVVIKLDQNPLFFIIDGIPQGEVPVR